jgi:ABC-type nitrate/sulfonate/bicarbonate transport system substrate-binding protein
MVSRFKILALGGAVGALVAGCGSSATGSSSTHSGTSRAASAKTTRVLIGYGAPVAEQLLPQFAVDEGLFAKYGLSVTVEQITNASAVIPGLRSGAIDYDVMSSPQPEEGAAAGVDLKWLAMWNSKPDIQICVAPGINSAQDLIGKAVGISSTGSTTGVLLQHYLLTSGIAVDKVHLVPLGSEGAQAQSFAAGEIAAFACGPPVTQSVLAKRKGAKVLVNLATKYEWNGAGLVGYMPWVESHTQTTEKVVKVIAEAWAKWKASPSAAEAALAQATGVPAAAAAAAYHGSIIAGASGVAPSVAIEASVLPVLAKQLPATKSLTASQMVDTAFAG